MSRDSSLVQFPKFVSRALTADIGAIREVARRFGVLLISDEVLNFRQSYHGAAARFGVAPGLCTLGRFIGGGLPIGAIAGTGDDVLVENLIKTGRLAHIPNPTLLKRAYYTATKKPRLSSAAARLAH